MYESPINIIISKLCTQLESDCVKYVQSYGFDVDKEELAKALNYDRKQYEKGHTDGYNKAIDDFKKMLNIEKIKEYAESDGFINLNNCSLMIFEVAEQLKAGGKE